MTTWITRRADWLAWLMVGLFVVLMATGLGLETVTGSFLSSPWYGFLTGIGQFVWVVVAALLISRQPLHPIGWLFCFGALGTAIDHFAYGYAYYGLVFHPGSLPGVKLVALWLNWSGRAVGAAGVALLFLLFPTGRPLSRRWGKVAWIAIGATLVYVATAAIASNPVFDYPFSTRIIALGAPAQAFLQTIVVGSNVLANLCAAAALVSLFVRLTRAEGVERQQIKWFVYASALFPLGIVLLLLSLSLPETAPNWLFPLALVVLAIFIAGLPIASAIAILRYRLYDIDIIIHRTLVYGLLTAALAIVYFTAVVLLQQIFQTLTGQQSPIAIVVSTLLIAALFSPLRRRIQNFIDRRFYRRKYDAAGMLAEFAAAARDEVDLNRLTAELLRLVNETMQPESVSLWLKEP